MNEQMIIKCWASLREAIDAYITKRRQIEPDFMPGLDRTSFDGIDIDTSADHTTTSITIRWTDTVGGWCSRNEETLSLHDLFDSSLTWFAKLLQEQEEAKRANEQLQTAAALRRAQIAEEISKLQAEDRELQQNS